MNLSIVAAGVLLFTVASGAPLNTANTAVSTTERHIVKHHHKVNCLNCFCGHKALERARHSCTKDRDLVLCPPSIPVRVCYRCSCFPRIPVSPSPLLMTPHPDDRKHDDHDHKHHNSHDHDADHDADHENEDVMMPTPYEDDPGMHTPDPMSAVPRPSKKPHPANQSTVTGQSSSLPNSPPSPSKKPEPCHHTPLPTPSPKSCATFSRGGGGGSTMFDVNLVHTSGTFKVSWRMDSVPDRVEIFYEGKKIYTTEVPVSGTGMANVSYSGDSSVITVWITSPTSGTGWFMEFECPAIV